MRLELNIEKIANELGLPCEKESGAFKVNIGLADWNDDGIPTDMTLIYRHEPLTDVWKHSEMKDEEFHILIRQIFPTAISLQYVDDETKLFNLLASLKLIQMDIGSWRRNYFGAQYNREMDKILGVLN